MRALSYIKKIQVVFIFVGLFSLSACDLFQNTLETDRDGSFSIQDYRDGFAPRDPELDEEDDFSSIPDLDPYVLDSADSIKPMPLVSVSVNGAVPLRDILYELAQQAEYDLELDPNIRGSIIFTATDRPFDQVIERIADVAGLRYSMRNDVLRIETDTPYNKIYKIDYLNFVRTNTGVIRNDIAVVSGEEADTGSSFEASAASEADFWGELDNNLTQILGNVGDSDLNTNQDPQISLADQVPDVVALDPNGQGGVSPPDAVLRVEALPVGEDDGIGVVSGDVDGNLNRFAINRHAGLVSVYAPEAVHEEVLDYLKIVKKTVTSQVLIEAKVLEVSLSDQYAAGIDWNVVNLFNKGTVLQYGTTANPLTVGNALNSISNPVTQVGGTLFTPPSIDGVVANPTRPINPGAGSNNFMVGFLGSDIEALVQAIQGFGTVRALASPRLTVLNNQSSVMNIATNQVFFELDVDVTTEEGVTTTEIDSEIRNVPEGVLVNVIPSIDLDDNTISLAVRPTITRITGQESDPAVEFISGGAIQSFIPELNVQEIDTVVKTTSGRPIILGGLLQDRIETEEEAVPVLGELPVMGNLFKSQLDAITKTELVILIKATIVEGDDTIHTTDKDFYRKFSGDRRPFKL